MGISMEVVAGELLGHMAYSERIVGNARADALHGGTLGALMEATAVFTVLAQEAPVIKVPKTIGITVDYLRSAGRRDTWARALFTRQGRRVASVRILCWQQDRDKPVAAANAHFLLSPMS